MAYSSGRRTTDDGMAYRPDPPHGSSSRNQGRNHSADRGQDEDAHHRRSLRIPSNHPENLPPAGQFPQPAAHQNFGSSTTFPGNGYVQQNPGYAMTGNYGPETNGSAGFPPTSEEQGARFAWRDAPLNADQQFGAGGPGASVNAAPEAYQMTRRAEDAGKGPFPHEVPRWPPPGYNQNVSQDHSSTRSNGRNEEETVASQYRAPGQGMGFARHSLTYLEGAQPGHSAHPGYPAQPFAQSSPLPPAEVYPGQVHQGQWSPQFQYNPQEVNRVVGSQVPLGQYSRGTPLPDNHGSREMSEIEQKMAASLKLNQGREERPSFKAATIPGAGAPRSDLHAGAKDASTRNSARQPPQRTESRQGEKHHRHDEPTQESDEEEELQMEVTALEKCIEVLINQGKKGVLRRDKLLEKTGIDKATLAKILSNYAGIIGGYHVNGKSGNKRERQVGVIPVFRLCTKHRRSKGCTSRTCRDLHICCGYLLTRECKFIGSKKTRSRGKGDKDEKRRSCPFGHTLDDPHNLRVLRKVLEVQEIRIFSPETLLDLVTFCCEDDDEDESEADGSCSDSSASSESSADDRRGRKSKPKRKGRLSRGSDDSGSRGRSGSNGTRRWGTRKMTQKSSYDHGAASNRKPRTPSPKHGLRGDRGSRSARYLENRGAVGGGSTSYDQGFMKSDSEKAARFVPIICADHAKGRCKFAGPGCGKVHGPPGKLYQWQAKDINTNGPWLSLTDGHSDQLEGEFAKPEIIKVNLQPRKSNDGSSCVYPSDDANQVIKASSNWTADFDTMTVSETVSSNGNHRVLLLRRVGGYPKEGPTSGTGDTLWHWYFFDNKQRWVKYGEKAEAVYNTGRTTSSDTTSDRIEEHFITELRRTGGTDGPALPETAALKAHPLQTVQPLFFKTDYHQYLLDFTKLVQRNISVGTERPICRRPAPGPSGYINAMKNFLTGNRS